VALLSDTHIAADPALLRGDVNMSEHFKRVRSDLLTCPTNPSMVLINGDCAFLDGQKGDYKTLIDHLAPIRQAGKSLALNLGNHDDRGAFQESFASFAFPESPVMDKHATMIDAGPVRWFLLDSLEKVNETPGTLGTKQLQWLDESLGKHADKPALVMAHHHLDGASWLSQSEVLVQVAGNRLPVPGLTDSARLLEIMKAHRHVSAYFCGHTHQWNVVRWEGIHLVNLPCVAYPFTPKDPAGWVLSRSEAASTELELCALDRTHPMHGKKVTLKHDR
jgi:3',5'-cyclic AMP phosphodiesterase CpdA